MITHLNGKLVEKNPTSLVVECSGIGYEVRISLNTFSLIPSKESVFIYTQFIVREDALTLFGFESLEEIEVFEHMITVSGVGPKSALGVLSSMSPYDIAQAVINEDDKAFRQAPGIGPKTSKLLIISLAGKLDHMTPAPGVVAAPSKDVAERGQVILGLQGLGWAEAQAEQAVSDALDAGAPGEAAQLMRAALKLLQSGQGGTRR